MLRNKAQYITLPPEEFNSGWVLFLFLNADKFSNSIPE